MAAGTSAARRVWPAAIVTLLVVAVVLAFWLSSRGDAQDVVGSDHPAPSSPAPSSPAPSGTASGPDATPSSDDGPDTGPDKGSDNAPGEGGTDERPAEPDPTAEPDAEGGTGPTEPSAGQAAGEASPPPDGSGLEVVPVEPVRTKPPVPLDERADFGDALTARVLETESVQGVAHGPGEIAGPALRVTLEMRNTADRRMPLDKVVVVLTYGPDHAPAPLLSGPGAEDFPASVAAHGSETARFVFAVPADQRDRISVAVSHTATRPTVVFQGSAV